MNHSTKRAALSALAFLAVIALFCGIAWMSGYNFDKRNAQSGEVSAYAAVFSIFAAVVAFAAYGEKGSK